MDNIIEFPDKNVIEDEASRWIIKFEGDEPPTRQDIEALKAWMSQSPTHREVLKRFASNWNDMDLLAELVIPVEQAQKPKGISLKNLVLWDFAPIVLLVRLARLMTDLTRPAIALSLVFVLSVSLSSWLILHQRNLAENIYVTSVGEQSNRTLDDGSVVSLNTDSKVEVIYSDQKRKIILHKGEAHFKVSPDPQRPFEVYAGKRMIRAVGTAFTVYLDHDQVKVTVTEGKVDLAVVMPSITKKRVVESSGKDTLSNGEKPTREQQAKDTPSAAPEVLGSLVAGQSIVVPDSSRKVMDDVINHEHQELARRLSWIAGQLVFAGESLDEVVREVSRYTDLNIEVADPELKSMRIGGQFQVGETEALFDVLETSFGLQISRLSDRHVQIRARN